MTTKTLAALVVAAATALPLAASAGAGADQIARSLGVAPGSYSLSQLAQIADYMTENSSRARQQIQFILDNPKGSSGTVSVTTRSATVFDQSGFPASFFGPEPNRLND